MTVTIQQAAAVVTFLSLSGIGFYTVLYHIYASTGNQEVVQLQCPQPPTYKHPAQLRYTGFAGPDAALCNLVAFFHASFVPQNIGYTVHFLAGIPPVSLAYLIESARADSSRSVLPLVVGLGYQALSGAGIMPLGWLALILSSAGRPDRARKPLSRGQAESVFAGVMLGYVLPTAAMLLLQDEYVTGYWQVFPIYIWSFQRLWLLVRPAPAAVGSGFAVVRAALITAAAISAAPHLHVLYHNRSLAAFLQWWPSFSVPEPSKTTYYTAAFHLLQWDSIVWYTCSVLAAAFMAGSRSEAFTLLVVAPLASAVISPGAVVALYWLRREEKLLKLDKSASSRVSKNRKMR
ncbi:hypothetical protein AURDEDRAFT_114912 [Auricularia subglabra TFB-10046 SS5]|nr:hypothetical protein AURDEDRAFT_114912 [Auricularia subglabra TFB-10046 SS5]